MASVIGIIGCSQERDAAVSNLNTPMFAYHYPKAVNMPPVVEESMESLLGRLETVLEQKAPQVASALQPGLSEADVERLETQYDVKLPDDLRLLYRWHNGIPWNSGPTLTHMHEFYPLDYALEQRAKLAHELGSQKESMKRLVGPTLSWMPIFQDLAGDGYYFDPARSANDGAVFDNFRETASYTFFRSIKNVVAGIVECYDTNVYYTDSDGSINADFEAERRIWQKYGSEGPAAY